MRRSFGRATECLAIEERGEGSLAVSDCPPPSAALTELPSRTGALVPDRFNDRRALAAISWSGLHRRLPDGLHLGVSVDGNGGDCGALETVRRPYPSNMLCFLCSGSFSNRTSLARPITSRRRSIALPKPNV